MVIIAFHSYLKDGNLANNNIDFEFFKQSRHYIILIQENTQFRQLPMNSVIRVDSIKVFGNAAQLHMHIIYYCHQTLAWCNNYYKDWLQMLAMPVLEHKSHLSSNTDFTLHKLPM